MTCKDCVHYERCIDWCEDFGVQLKGTGCSFFKNKVDIVEVVKCKDCEFVEPTKIKLNGKDLRICGLYKRPCFDNDFCSRGVLKE